MNSLRMNALFCCVLVLFLAKETKPQCTAVCLSKEIAALKAGIKGVEKELSAQTADLHKGTKDGMVDLKDEVHQAKETIGVLKTDVDEMKAEMKMVLENQKEMLEIIKESGSVAPATAAPTKAPKPTQPTDVRLPTNLEPTLYEVELLPYLEESDGDKRFTFEGAVTVHLKVLEATNMIILHFNDMTIDTSSIKLVDKNGADVGFGEWIHDEARQFFKLPVNDDLIAGDTYQLTLGFVGNLNDKLVGFYRSSYKRQDGSVQYLATTQFQPTDARRAFPCMDEPGIKSKFRITMKSKVIGKYTAISNMPGKKTETDAADVWTFEETPKMSTYLIAFVLSDFHHISKTTKGGVKVSVWAREDAMSTTKYALDAGVAILDHFGEFFQQPFPLPKQDMIAVPDFNAGAMENWGLVTYRETALLYDPNDSSLSDKQRVCLVVAHELAHQWFGNLVTPAWWNDLWLNEGFASYVENIGIELVEEDVKIMDQFVSGELQPVLVKDSIASSHPISQPVGHPDQINELFDSISYSKGASIIRMMDFFLGRGNFQNGLSDYLDTFKYGNTESKDLWNKLTKAVNGTARHVDVANVMDTWTLQMGYPVVTVNKNGASATVSQKRFLLDGESIDSEGKFGYKWEVPFTYATKAKPQWNSSLSEINWMNKAGADLTLSGLDADSWIIGNVEQMGYYRVNYDADNWNKIIKQLADNHMEIDVKNRAQILGDVFNLARGNELSYNTAFRTTKYLKTEADYIPWAAGASAMGFVGGILSTTDTYRKYEKYIIALGEDRYNALGFDEGASDAPLTIYLRAKIVSLMCSSGYQPCLDAAVKSLKQWKTTEAASPGAKNPVNLNLRSQIYCYGIQNGDSEVWDFMFEMYKKEDVAAEKKRIMRSLACSKEPLILSRLLELAVSDQPNNPIRRQDTTSVIQYVAVNDVGKFLAWDFIRENWDMLRAQFGGGSFSFSKLILAVTSTFASDYKLKQLEAFMKSKTDLGSAARAFVQAIEKTKANIKWLDANLKEVNKWLEANV